MPKRLLTRAVLLVATAAMLGGLATGAVAQGRAALDGDAKRAYNKLVASVPAAKAVANRAVAVLVFPKIVKAGLMVGGQYGEGVLMRAGKPVGYYSTAGASYGLQAGAQEFGYAMFFMNDGALKALTDTSGFEVGVGPSIVVVDEGMAKSATSITMKDDVYAFIFKQQGLMAGVGLQGNKITKLTK